MKKRISLVLLSFVLIALLLTSCGGSPATDMAGGNYAPSYKEEVSIDSSGVIDVQKLIVTVNYTIETLTFDETLDEVEAAVKACGGYIQSSNVTPRGENGAFGVARLTIRIPTAEADHISNTLEGVGKVTSHSENTQDVTMTYADIEARIESLEAQYARVLAMYETAKNLSELVTVEKRLTEISSELSSLKNQMKAMENKISYATYYITLYDVLAYSEEAPETYWQEFGRSFVTSFENFIHVIGRILIVLLYLLPYLIIAAGITVLVVWRRRVKRAKGKKGTDQQ